jgi:hypothetical protein
MNINTERETKRERERDLEHSSLPFGAIQHE